MVYTYLDKSSRHHLLRFTFSAEEDEVRTESSVKFVVRQSFVNGSIGPESARTD